MTCSNIFSGCQCLLLLSQERQIVQPQLHLLYHLLCLYVLTQLTGPAKQTNCSVQNCLPLCSCRHCIILQLLMN
jgi:hypothetical protein